jgi:hypothetical protein
MGDARPVLPILLDVERTFLELVINGEVQKVKDFVKSHPDLNVNCSTFQVDKMLGVLFLE